ncbi:MAG: N-acetyltransferase [Bacteroidetes bacterium]|nr:N-acetyltransferase [Bacteroidota bacterium]
MPHIRPVLPSDTSAILDIYLPFVADTPVTFEYQLPGFHDFRNRIEAISLQYPFLVLEENGELLGYAYASRHREREAYKWAVETSIYMADNARGRGLGQTLYSQLLNMLVERKFTRAYGIITLPNPASEKLHARCGFRHLTIHEKAGYKLDRWHDVLWMEKNLAGETTPALTPFFGPA